MSGFVTVTANTNDPTSVGLREQYFAMRKKAFDTYWGHSFYPAGPDAYDLNPSTVYGLYVQDGNVLGGARLLMHTPGTHEQMRSEAAHPKLALASMLPHVNTHTLSYCEYSGGAVDPHSTLNGDAPKHLGSAIAGYLFSQIKSGAIKNGEYPVAIVMGVASKRD